MRQTTARILAAFYATMESMRAAAIGKIFLLTLCLGFVSCARTEVGENSSGLEVIVVRVPPLHDSSLTPLQNHSRFQRFLFPRPGNNEAVDFQGKTGTWADLPNDHSLIYVELSVNREVSINKEPQASLGAVTQRLSEVFKAYEEKGVFEPESERIVKAVGIKLPNSAKYSDLIKVAKAVKESGADPIIVLLERHLPYQITDGQDKE
ncbi:MAG: hypothetical protein WKF92_15825 [Pyrinomonadaceae bacterium]